MMKIPNLPFVQIFCILFVSALFAFAAYGFIRGEYHFPFADRNESSEESYGDRLVIPLGSGLPDGFIALDGDLKQTDGPFSYIQNTATQEIYAVGVFTNYECTFFAMLHDDGTYMTVDEVREEHKKKYGST